MHQKFSKQDFSFTRVCIKILNRVENNFEIVAFLLFWELRNSAENVAGRIPLAIS